MDPVGQYLISTRTVFLLLESFPNAEEPHQFISEIEERMPCIMRPSRQSDYNSFTPDTPIVIDNGGSTFRIGWAGESNPRLGFRNVVQRPRHKATGETVTIVGDHDPSLMKYFDCTRSSHRSAFDSNVVYQFEIMEYIMILDFGFERMGADGSQVYLHHVVEVRTRTLNLNLNQILLAHKAQMLGFAAFGVDAAFSYKNNQKTGLCYDDGLAICAGFTTSHIIPGEPVLEACCRTNVGGYHITDYLKQLLSLKYPYHTASITWDKVEELKIEHCYISLDYASEAQLFQGYDHMRPAS
ncbi:Actin-related protein 5 [Asimina triloba]